MIEERADFGIDGHVVLITGAGRGQGAAEAELFAAHGAKVIVADIDEAAGRRVAAACDNSLFCPLDVAKEQDWDRAISFAAREFGRLDILVNNAAVTHFGSIADTMLADFMSVLQINLAGTFLGMQKALPMLSRQGGAIINISSISGLTGRVNQSAYMASKWAIRGLTKAAALEFSQEGIRVNTIFPGLIKTDMTLNAYGHAGVTERGAAIPVGRAGEPRDIARLALFVASPLAGFCNGAEFVADGGETAGSRPMHEEAALA